MLHRNTVTCRYLELYVGTVISRKLNGINIPEPPQSLAPANATSDASSSPKGGLKGITLLVADANARLQQLRGQARLAVLPFEIEGRRNCCMLLCFSYCRRESSNACPPSQLRNQAASWRCRLCFALLHCCPPCLWWLAVCLTVCRSVSASTSPCLL